MVVLGVGRAARSWCGMPHAYPCAGGRLPWQVIMAAADKPRKISSKQGTDIVTDTDKASEAACVAAIQVRGGCWVRPLDARLLQRETHTCLQQQDAQQPLPCLPPQAAFPQHAILGEEGGVMGDVSSDYLW